MIPEPIYVSGPMTHYVWDNYDAFESACRMLRALGHQVRSPHEIKVEGSEKMTRDEKWQAFMRADIVLLLNCNSIVVLPGWECSRGANLEVHIAHGLRMPVLPLAQLLRGSPPV